MQKLLGLGDFPLPLLVLLGNLIIKLTLDRLTGEKKLICVYGSPIDIEPEEDQNSQLLYFLGKETIHL